MANANEIALPPTKEGQIALLKRLLDTEAGGQLAEADVSEAMMQQFGDRVRVAATPDVDPAPHAGADLSSTAELAPEVLAECLAGLEKDYKRGIVVVDETKGVDHFKAALERDKTAGVSWEQVRVKLLANDSVLLKKAAGMQGKGTLIGVYANGELCMKDRGNEPVIYGKDNAGKQLKITTDTPNRDAAMQSVRDGGQFADYWEIRDAVHADGFTLPTDAPDHEKKGIVAAVEAVTNADFVRSANGKEWRSAVLDCGNVPQSALVRVVRFAPYVGSAHVFIDSPLRRDDVRGAVRVLRG